MSATFQNSAMVLSIGIFFSLIILGLSVVAAVATCTPASPRRACRAADATRLSHLPPTAVMFAALLGYNPIQMLLGPALTKLPAHSAAYLTGHSFFPSLISAPFQAGLQIAFDFSIAACLIAAVASLLRGKRYVHDELHAEPVLVHAAARKRWRGVAMPADQELPNVSLRPHPRPVTARSGRPAVRPRPATGPR